MAWKCRQFSLDTTRPLVMGIVNVTPDSFSDGGLYFRPGEAMARARNCVKEGADIVDFGGESTRPGAKPVDWRLEWSRLEPVLRQFARELPDVPFSVDTYHPETASRALDAGAAVINCVYEEPVPAMAELARTSRCGLIIPCRTVDSPSLAACRDLGDALVVDPMIGFDTTREEDIALLGSIRRLAAAAPVCVGVSRKRLIKRLVGERMTGKNLGGSVGAAVWCAMNGASVLRVHDVAETRQALAVAWALAEAEKGETAWTGSV